MIAYDHIAAPDLGGIYAPIIVCDACGQPIVKSGNVYWVVLPDGSVPAQIWHTHKYPCSRLDDHLETRFGGLVMSEELDRWLRQLAHNFTTANTR